ncbi:hypothetical protein L9F63_002917 [Diploptera punctata]|uniref:FAM69 protein-kinase domain-containing protein n=1 Tax=Diploptera punctata TaxID=6984 RepID=A0AAD7ZSE6_DIPPU|nr:hypothetical protein L9F63_002917 [Diploptera punctata]
MRASIILVSLAIVISIKILILPPITDLLELEKCPACYGTSMCPAFATEHIIRDTSSIDAIIFNMLGAKNIMLGLYLNKKVILKKLGHNSELDLLDKNICLMTDLVPGCNVSNAISQHDNLLSELRQLVTKSFTSSLRCPSSVHLENLLNFHENSKNDSKVFQANLWTVVSVNPEPLIMQVLRQEDGWPVAKYLGACGRIIVEEYVGQMLYTYYAAPWIQRASFAHQLLVAAYNFTYSHLNFSFYLTDISPDNIAVDANGRIKFVDLENVVVVDKNIPEEDKPPIWDTPHVSEIFDCEGNGCFAFSSDDICEHRLSDHNIYAVCMTLLHPETAPETLPGGLLHNTPPEHAHVMQLIEECAYSENRFLAANKLMIALAHLTQQHEELQYY